MTLSIRGDNHNIVRVTTDDIHVSIIVYRYTTWTLAVLGRTIYYCVGKKGLKMLNLSDKSVSDIINSDMSGVYYVATFADKLFYANTNTHTVACCDLHGTTQWEFKYERVLQCPRGISIDNDGNVYVVGSANVAT
jgi:hypothetical protein